MLDKVKLRAWFNNGTIGDEFELIKEQDGFIGSIELVVTEQGVMDEFYIVLFDMVNGYVASIAKAEPYKVIETKYREIKND